MADQTAITVMMLIATTWLMRVPNWAISRIVPDRWKLWPDVVWPRPILIAIVALVLLFLQSGVDLPDLRPSAQLLIAELPWLADPLTWLLDRAGASIALRVQIMVLAAWAIALLVSWQLIDLTTTILNVIAGRSGSSSTPMILRATAFLEGFVVGLSAILRQIPVRRGLLASLTTLVLFISMIPWLHDLTAHSMGPDLANRMWLGVLAFPWISVWLVLAELNRLSVERWEFRRIKVERTQSTTGLVTDLGAERLWLNILYRHGDLLLFANRPRHAQGETGGGGSSAPEGMPTFIRGILFHVQRLRSMSPREAAHLGTLLQRYLDHEIDLLVDEPLHRLHADILIELSKGVQDRGRVTLILCPDRDFEAVHDGLLHVRQTSRSAWQVNIGVEQLAAAGSGTAAEPSSGWTRQATVRLVKESEVPRLIGRLVDASADTGAELGFSVDRLGQIIALNVQDLDLSFLKMQLTRLVASGLRMNRTSVICQGHGWSQASLGKAVHETFQPVLDPRPPRFMPVQLLGRVRMPLTYGLVWRGDSETEAKLRGDYDLPRRPAVPVALSPAIPYVEQGCHPVLTDAGQSIPRNALRKLATTGGLAGELGHIAERSGHPLTIRDGLPDKEPAVVIVPADRLPQFHLDTWYDDMPPDSATICNIVLWDYPLRDYHVSLLKTLQADGGNLEEFAPILAPTTRGGIKELLSTLNDALAQHGDMLGPAGSRRRGLRREEIETRFLRPFPPALRQRLGITATKSGLEGLFRRFLRTQAGLDVKSERGPNGESRLYLGAPVNHAKLRIGHRAGLATKDSPSRLADLIETGDRYLLYFPGQRTILDGELVDIRDWEDVAPVGNLEQDSDTAPRNAGYLVYRHCRQLTDRRAEPQPGYLVHGRKSMREQRGVRVETWELSLSMERRVLGCLSYKAGAPIFNDDGRQAPGVNYRDLSDISPVSNEFQAAWHLRLTRMDSEPLATEVLRASAFALAVVFQDLLRSFFMGRAHRLQVMSPQARVWQCSDDDMSDRDRFLLSVYPRLETEGEIPDAAEFPWLGPAPAGPDPAGRIVDIIVLEDSDIDLGMVRTLHGTEMGFIDYFRRYVNWLEDQGWQSRYHRFGGATDSRFLDLSLVRNFLRRDDGEGQEVWQRWDDMPVPRGQLERDLVADDAELPTASVVLLNAEATSLSVEHQDGH